MQSFLQIKAPLIRIYLAEKMKNILLVLILLVLASCQPAELVNPEVTNTANCEVKDPIQDLAWLNALAHPAPDNPCNLGTISQGSYLGQTVFIIFMGGALCCTCAGSAVYNCQGELVFVCDLTEQAKIQNIKLIWQLK